MKPSAPQVVSLIPHGLLLGRKSQAVFVRKHNLDVNLTAAEEATERVTKRTARGWLFLIEGLKSYRTVENEYLDSLIDNFKIVASDPVLNPFTSSVADSAGIDRNTAALSILVMDFFDFVEERITPGANDEEVKEMIEHGLERIASAFSVKSGSLRKMFVWLRNRRNRTLKSALLKLSAKRKLLIAESNMQSRIRLRENLRINEQPNIFIMTGIEHATIFTE